jgi:arylsulfatase A-like enzyme
LLITIDTLRADRLGSYGDTQARTPTLDRLAREGVLFEQAFSVAPITLPAHASLMTGLLPPVHGVRGNGAFALPATMPTLAEALSARGVRCAAFVGGYPLARQFGLARGFEHYDDTLERAPGLHFEFAERRADAVVAAALDWLVAHPGPVFAWVHLFDPHAPYAPPAEFAAPDPYRGEIAAVDFALRSLVEGFGARPEPALIAVTADHGEAFGEHGEQSHSLLAYDTTLRVPLILHGPGISSVRRVRTPVSTVDLPATLLAHLGAGALLPGRDLLARPDAASDTDALYAETLAPRLDFGWSDLRVWRRGRHKLIRAPRVELYDVFADPGETHDLARQEPALRQRLLDELATHLASTADAESRQAADAQARERLRGLGYVQGPEGRGSGANPKDMLAVAQRIAAATGPFADHAEAARVYASIQALDPPNPLVNLRLADALLRAGQARAALPAYRRVLAAGPRTADAFVGLASAWLALGRLDEAEQALRQGLLVTPRDGQLNYNLGELARARGQRDEARARYAVALEDAVTSARAARQLQALR